MNANMNNMQSRWLYFGPRCEPPIIEWYYEPFATEPVWYTFGPRPKCMPARVVYHNKSKL